MSTTIEILSELSNDKIRELALKEKCSVKSILITNSIKLRKIIKKPIKSNQAIFILFPHGIGVVYSFGAIVLFNATAEIEAEIIEYLLPFSGDRIKENIYEHTNIYIQENSEEKIENGNIYLSKLNILNLELIANILAKSTILDLYETRIAQNFGNVEPIARNLIREGRLGYSATVLLKHIGASLLVEHNMVGKVELAEKPELLWDKPELDELYELLMDELEILDRKELLEHKIDLLTRTAQTSLDVLQHRHSSRLEWYIIILIIVSIIIELYAVIFH